jgi:hypothetical protein
MVNILIHQFQPGGAVVDEGALEQFQKQWATYQKLVDADCLSHRAVGTILHDTLNQTFAKPVSLLDIACGDASESERWPARKFITTTGSIFPSPRSSWLRTTSRTCRSRSSSTIATSSKR